MSGPIVRKYGFPNFDTIFGARPLQHGVDEEQEPASPAGEAPTPSNASSTAAEADQTPSRDREASSGEET